MGIKFANFVETTIADVGGVSAVATEFTVNAGDGALFPTLGASDYCYIVCVTAAGTREIMKVTDVSTDTLTVEREQEGTTGLVFAQDDVVQLRVTAGGLEDLGDEHEADTDPHSATDAATPSRLVLRDAAGRAKVVAPAVAGDIALKSTVTADIATHDALATAHGAIAGSAAADNHFTAGTFYYAKHNGVVTISWFGLTHASNWNRNTSTGFLPAAYRPPSELRHVFHSGNSYRSILIVTADGIIKVYHYTLAGSTDNQTAVVNSGISYIVP